MKFIHIADVHYGRAFSRAADIAETFGKIIDYANTCGIDCILSAGDMIEGEAASLSQLKSLRDEIARFKGTFFAVTGNHDPLGAQSAYTKVDFPENFKLFPPGFSYMDIGGCRIHGFSWKTNGITEIPDHIFEKSAENILLIHGDAAADSDYLPLPERYLKSLGMDYIALGHIHKPGFIAPNIAYSGTPEPLDSHETGAHGFILGEIGENKKFEFVPFSKATFIDKEIEINPEFSDVILKNRIAELISEQSDGVRLRLTVSGRFSPLAPIDTDAVKAQFENLTIINNTIPDYDFETIMRENNGNIIGKFIASFGDISALSLADRRTLEYGVEALLYSESQNERNSAK